MSRQQAAILRRRRRRNWLLGQGAFTPASLPGLNLWLDAADAATLWQDTAATTPAIANTDPIGRWDDLSGSGNHVIQATAGNRPTLATAQFNGRNIVKFTKASSQRLVKSSWAFNATEYAIFTVMSFTTNADLDGILSAIDASGSDFSDANGFTLFGSALKPSFYNFAGGGTAEIALAIGTIALTADAQGLVDIVVSGGNAALKVGGVNSKTDTYTAVDVQPTTLVVGARAANGAPATWYFDGKLAEVIILTTVPDAATITGIRNYLNTKWVIT